MPKALKAHPGERLDLPDYVLGANEYTQEVQKFLLEREFADRRSRVLDGFRIRVEDQTLNPGLITVFNGNGLDRDGQLINNEDLPNDSRSVTLLGATLNFYVEVEFTNVTSDTDARFFWDPTIPNVAPEPDGSEFALNVATRITPDWRIVTPVSTTGFQQTTNPNSIRIPIGVFRTDGGNQITTGPTNPGLTLVTPASVLESDTALGTVALRVVDARIFPATTPFNVTVDFGGAFPEPRIVTAVDRDNGILTVSVATAFAHQAGSIIRVVGTSDLVAQRVDPSDPLLSSSLPTPGHPDPAQRLWQADELRGSGLMQSKETFGARDDLNLRSLKDQIDFLSAQLRELKFGHPRPDVLSQAPPATFATRPRYFDRAGSVQGARSNTLSIGNGTTTFGDLNGTTDAVFIAAINALPATGGTIFVKGGTYTFASTVVVGKQVTFVGEGFSAVNIINNVAAGPAFSVTVSSAFRSLTLSKAAGGLAVAIDVAGTVTVTLDNCVVNTACRINGAVNGAIRATGTAFTPSTAVACISATGGGTLTLSSFTDCSFVSGLTAFSCPMNTVSINGGFMLVGIGFLTAGATDIIQHVNVSRTSITVVSSVFASQLTQVVTGVSFSYCNITVTGLAIDGAVFLLSSTGLQVDFQVADNYINVTGVAALTEANPGAIVRTTANGQVSSLAITNNDITCPAGSYTIGLFSDCADTILATSMVANNTFQLAELVRIGSSANNMIGGDFVITDNRHDNNGSTSIAMGVRLWDTPTARNVVISRNMFVNYNSAVAGARIGVEASWNTLLGVDVLIENNIFSSFDSGSSALGVNFDNVVAAPQLGAVRVHGNKFQQFSAIGALSVAAGVFANPFNVSNLINFEIVDNTMLAFSSATFVYGVYHNAVFRGTVHNNQVFNMISTAAAGEGVSVYLANSSNVTVSNNRLHVATSDVGAPILRYGALIKVTGVSEYLSITDNVCSQAGAGGTASGHIMVVSDSAQNIQINDNRVVSGATQGVYGILVSRNVNTAATITNVQICDNHVNMRNSGPFWTGIHVLLGGNSSSIEIHDNLIRESNLTSTVSAIYVQGHDNPVQTRAVSVCNNVLSGAKVGAPAAGRAGIQIVDCMLASVNDNLIDWLEPLLATGNGINILTILGGIWRQFNVVGNNVRPAFGLALSLVPASMQDGQAHSNVFGDAITAGVIFPALAAGGWTYGAAALANFNKLT